MIQPYTLGFSTMQLDGGNVAPGSIIANALYAGSVEAYKINTVNLAAGSITTTLLAVGPQFQFRSTNGGQQMTMNQDGSLSLPTTNTNPTDARWVADSTRSYSAAQPVKTFAATFYNPTTKNCGIVFNLTDPFATTGQTGILVWMQPATGTLMVYRCLGVAGYTSGTSFTGLTFTGTDRLVVQYFGSQGTPRMRVFLNGAEVGAGTLTDALLGSHGGAKGGCAGFLITDSTVQISEVVMGNQTVILEDGRVQAQHVDAVSIGASSVIISNIVGGINAGATTINGGKITTNTIVADHIQVATINASSAWLNAVDAKILTARSILADKIESRATNFINNFTMTGTVVNWSTPGTLTTVTRGTSVIRAMRLQTSGDVECNSDYFEVDASKSYTFKLSALTGPEAAGGSLYFGLTFIDKDGGNCGGFPLTGAPGSYAWGSVNTNPYFHIANSSYGDGGRWLDFTGIVCAADTPANLAPPLPTSGNNPYLMVNGVPASASLSGVPVFKMPPNCVKMGIRFLNYYNSGTTRTVYFHNPSIAEMGSGQISADVIRAGALVSSGDGSTGAYATAVVVNDGASNIAYTPPVGYKISNVPFTARLRPALNKDLNATYLTSRPVSVQAEFGSSISLGGFMVGELTQRTLNALDAPPMDAPGSTTGPWYLGTARVFYRGNIDLSFKGGAPDITCLSVKDFGAVGDAGGYNWMRWQFRLQPASASSNLDAMRYAKVQIYNTTGATLYDTFYVPLKDRLYAHATDSNAANAVYIDHMVGRRGPIPASGSSPYPFLGALKITLYNAYGASDERWFNSANVIDTWYTNFSTPSGGSAPSGGGGSGGGGGYCPWIGTGVLMATGETRAIGDIRVDDEVYTREENGAAWGIRRVIGHEIVIEPCMEVLFTDGRSLKATPAHRLAVGDAWVEIQHLTPGTIIDGFVPGEVQSITPCGYLPVVRMTVEDFHTYVTEGVLSHNLKLQTPY